MRVVCYWCHLLLLAKTFYISVVVICAFFLLSSFFYEQRCVFRHLFHCVSLYGIYIEIYIWSIEYKIKRIKVRVHSASISASQPKHWLFNECYTNWACNLYQLRKTKFRFFFVVLVGVFFFLFVDLLFRV